MNDHLSKHKDMYERHQRGETISSLAAAYWLSSTRVRQMINRWERELALKAAKAKKNQAFIVTFLDGQTAIHEAETSQEIFNQFKGKVLNCIQLETIKGMIAQYEDEKFLEATSLCSCGHTHQAHFNHIDPISFAYAYPEMNELPAQRGLDEGQCKYCDCDQFKEVL